MTILVSRQDASVNWVTSDGGGGFFETRFVQRSPKYFSVYVSCQSACNHGCGYCHLTETKQVRPTDLPLHGLKEQVSMAVSHSSVAAPDAEMVHFNFMTRGEPLASRLLLDNWEDTANFLRTAANTRNLRHKVLVSTIMPKSVEDSRLTHIFPIHYPEIYYSIYSMDEEFRRMWMPKAMPADKALDALDIWQQETNKIPRLHFAFIKGVNDSEKGVTAICDAVTRRGLRVNVNVVRYNPPNRWSKESDEQTVGRLALQMKDLLRCPVKVVTRVGYDVYASCGMFVPLATP